MAPNGPDPDDTLRRIEQRLDRASAAAERLIGEVAKAAAGAGETRVPGGGAAGKAGGGAGSGVGAAPDGERGDGDEGRRRPPPQGWQLPEPEDLRGARESELFAQLIESLRELIPPDLQRRLAEALRELLLAMLALIDWYLERLERRSAEPREVQDIPIN